ncbi:hypothetical protein C8Q80DRAFT_1122458 [Daedaleopsis nitida]|nr:hypothetical protein C8Q80DRAFT_1122458 [Daedaleopsis nitida]
MRLTPILLSGACALLALPWPTSASPMKVTSFSGPVTAEEIDSFNGYVATLTPAANNSGNEWVQGHTGEHTKAMGLVYLMAGKQATLDQMIRFCDAVLSQRNDLAPAPLGQRKVWTGRIDPVWPNDLTQATPSTGGSRAIPWATWLAALTIGDPHKYGATYKERAQTYLTQADYSMSHHILNSLLDLSNGKKMYFAANSPYKGGDSVPWNQQMMFNYALQNLCNAHRILRDNSTLLGEYKSIIVASLQCWAYAPPSTTGEDSNHGALDVAGFARADITGDYGITKAQMTMFANMFVDVMTLGPKEYAGKVDGTNGDGHASPTTYVRPGYLFLAEFRPDAYKSMVGADLTEGGTTTGTDTFSRFLWVKNQRYLSSTT